jgi:hypothetical protein
MCFLSKDDNIQSLEVNDLQLEKDLSSAGEDFAVVIVRDDGGLENQAGKMCYRNDCVVSAPMPSKFFQEGRRSTIVARGSVSIQQFEKLSYQRIGEGRALRGALRNLAGALVVSFEKSVELDVATQVESKLDNAGEYDGPFIEGLSPQDDSPRPHRLGLALGVIALAALVGGALLAHFRDKVAQTDTELGVTDDALSTE